MIRDVYGNSRSSGFTSAYFANAAPGSKIALLASPFYSMYEPIHQLTSHGCAVSLVIRLCKITTPKALWHAIDNPSVKVHYFTGHRFHAKLYIVDDTALVGSANLTSAGLESNREVSVVLRRGNDDAFDELPGLFDGFWNASNVLTNDILIEYEKAWALKTNDNSEIDFERLLRSYVELCEPENIDVSTLKKSHRRSFIQEFRRKYDELLNPAFNEVMSLFAAVKANRPEFEGADLNTEVNRFLGWLRLSHAQGESWASTPLLDASHRAAFLNQFLQEWKTERVITFGDLKYGQDEIENVKLIRTSFETPEKIKSLPYKELFGALTGIHAFYDLLRFTKGGMSGLEAHFTNANAITKVESTLIYLIFGPGDVIERAYDCIHDPKYKLVKFGESCVMELIGWMNNRYHPINGRTIKALRFLGFDVGRSAPIDG